MGVVRVITLLSISFNKGTRLISVEINTVSKTMFACLPDIADNQMKMTFGHLLVEHRARTVKKKKREEKRNM